VSVALFRRAPRELSHGPGTESDASLGRLELALDDGAPAEPRPSLVNAPNIISLSGYAATLGWLAGGPPLLAVLGLVADEADGRVARELGQTSDFGGLLDWGIDITLTGLVLARLGWTWALLFVTPAQVYLRNAGFRPTIGSARAAFTIISLLRGAP
jgi:hypothetical protein